jgi:putative transposase
MGGRRYRSSIPGPALFFATTSADGRIEIFDSNDRLGLAEEILFQVARRHEAVLTGYVIMPNHVHFLIGMREGGKQLSSFMHSYKGNVRQAIYGNAHIWQQRFDDLVITSQEQFTIKLNYMHWNPVKRQLVNRPEAWRFSSYRFWAFGEENPHLVRDFDWFADRVAVGCGDPTAQ